MEYALMIFDRSVKNTVSILRLGNYDMQHIIERIFDNLQQYLKRVIDLRNYFLIIWYQ